MLLRPLYRQSGSRLLAWETAHKARHPRCRPPISGAGRLFGAKPPETPVCFGLSAPAAPVTRGARRLQESCGNRFRLSACDPAGHDDRRNLPLPSLHASLSTVSRRRRFFARSRCCALRYFGHGWARPHLPRHAVACHHIVDLALDSPTDRIKSLKTTG